MGRTSEGRREAVRAWVDREAVRAAMRLVGELAERDAGGPGPGGRYSLGGPHSASLSRFVELAIRHELMRWRE